MTYTITDDCIACAACEQECEEGAIRETDSVFAVDRARCSECGACSEICPVEACVPAE